MERTERLNIIQERAHVPSDLAPVRAGLLAFNESQVGPVSITPIALYLRNAEGTTHGGLVGFLAWQWLTIDLFWVDAPLRGQGYGSALLEQAESAARSAGCVAVRLETYEFQARSFYERRGYTVSGMLEGYPAGTRTYSMRKSL